MRHLARHFAIAGGQQVSGVVPLSDAQTAGALVVLAHGAGNDMRNPLLVALADALAEHGFPTVRFNFPYKERGAGAPDPPAVLEACYRAVLAQLRSDPELGTHRLVIGGKSMGGRIASHLAAAGEAVDGLLFLGYPLHPAGKPEQLRAAHLRRVTAPMLFLAGTRDSLCRLDLLRGVLDALPRATLHVVEDGDHSFAVRKRSGRDPGSVRDEIVEASVAWLRTVGRA
jgi:hypothetical protein